MSRTERAVYTFAVKEYADGTPWIAFEPIKEDLKILAGGVLGFDLLEGTTYEEAEEIARYLDAHLGALGHTPR